MILTREIATGLQVRDDGDGRILFGPMLLWNVEARVLDAAAWSLRRSSAAPWPAPNPGRIPLTARHPRDASELPIGRLVELEERDDAAWMAARVSRTALGDEVLSLAADGVPLGLGIGFREAVGGSRWSPDRRRVVRTRAELDHLASFGRGPTSAPASSGSASTAHGRPRRIRCCPWPACAMAKRYGTGDAQPARLRDGRRRLCLSCQRPVVFGDHCQDLPRPAA